MEIWLYFHHLFFHPCVMVNVKWVHCKVKVQKRKYYSKIWNGWICNAPLTIIIMALSAFTSSSSSYWIMNNWIIVIMMLPLEIPSFMQFSFFTLANKGTEFRTKKIPQGEWQKTLQHCWNTKLLLVCNSKKESKSVPFYLTSLSFQIQFWVKSYFRLLLL